MKENSDTFVGRDDRQATTGHCEDDSASSVVVRPLLRHDPFDLTDIQHAYWFGRRAGLELGGVSSHLYLEFEGSALDLARLTQALRRVVDRHDMLRAVVDSDGRQRVLARVQPYQIAVTDLREVSDAERSRALDRVRHHLREQVLPADQWPLFDVRVTLLGADTMRLHLSIDLMFLDIRSALRMVAEWHHCYDDPAWSPSPLELCFRDYVVAEEALRGDAAGAQAEQYWLARLDTLPAAPDLPLTVAPEQVGRPGFVHHRVVLKKDQWAALAAAAARRGVTPSVLLLAAYCEVLRTWSKSQEFTVTVTSTNRLPVHPQVDDILGQFTSPSLLAVTGGAHETFESRLTHIQRQLDADLSHSLFNGVRVMRELTRRQRDGRASMPVVFSSALDGPETYTDHDRDALHAFGDLVDNASQTPQIWLENQVLPTSGGEVIVTWNAVNGLFPAGTLDAMFGAYRALLDRVTNDDDTVWRQTGGVVPLPSEQDDEQRRANATATPFPPTRLHDLVAEAARRTPDAVAVIADGAEYSYRWLTDTAHRIARRLREIARIEPNTLVAVSMQAGAEQIAALLGVLHSGAAYVCIDPDLPEQRRHLLLRRCRVEVVVTRENLRYELAWIPEVEVITPTDDATRRCSPDRLDSGQGYDDLAYVIFTSGSTGEPKGVMISHRSACNTIQDINTRFAVTEADRVLALAPTGFDLSVYDIFGVLGAGGAVVVVPSAQRAGDVTHWSELVGRYGVTVWNSVPAPMRMWVDDLDETAAPAGNRLRLILLSGDWIPTDLPGKIRKHFPEAAVISLGGATEGSIWSVCFPIDEVPPQWPSIPYGKPLANQTLHVYNAWLEPCPTWVTGEIYIGGTGVAAGYWNDQVRTDERFLAHPRTGERIYRTGDLGRYLPGGDIEILGREDHQVKINGYRVELGEIEAALSRQPGVRQALVAAPPHPRTGQRQVAAYLVVEDPVGTDGTATTDPATLREAVAGLLPSFMVPSHYLVIDRLPLTPNGKIDHAALPSPWSAETEAHDRVAPATTVEEQLMVIWSKQLGHSDFGTEDGFFDVGGDSLHAMGILRETRAVFGIGPDTEQDLIEGLFMNADITTFGKIITSVLAYGP
jgi:amino acid adenylation domain-containing protein